MKTFLKKRKLNIICSVAAIVLMWLIWIIAYRAVQNEYIIPSFLDTLKSLAALFTEKSFWTAFGNTLLRTIYAFIVSFVLAAVLAALSALNKICANLIRPFMILLRTLPTLAVILILLIWTKPKIAPVIVTVLVLFPMIYAQMTAAIGDVDFGIREMAQVYSVKMRDRLFKIYLPLISPNVLSQTGANVSMGLKIMVSAEVLANTFKSLGNLMQNARLYVDMPRLAALTVTCVLLGLVIDVALSQLVRLTFRWNRKEGVS